MNLRCIYCQTPFTLSRTEMLGAIITMNEKGQNHYDAHCPRCRRANSISRQRMELFFPNWQEAAKQLAAAPPVAPPPATASTSSVRTEPVSKAMKAAVAKQASATAVALKEKKSEVASRKSSATSSSKEKKATANKSAVTSPPKGKKAPAKGKKK